MTSTSTRGTFSTLPETYSHEQEAVIKEGWMNGPTMRNFTGCGNAGWNAFKPPCGQCYETGTGSRWCNPCKPQSRVQAAAGMQPASWLPF